MARSFTSPSAVPILLSSLAAFAVCAQDGGDPTRSAADYACFGGDDDDILDDLFDDDDDDTRFTARVRGSCEVPSISTNARGQLTAEIDDASSLITWTLTYEGLEAPVEQAHIHLGELHTNGGVSAFLCTNLDNGPADTQPCPEESASIEGAITPEHVVGPADQGIAEGEFAELVRAIRAGAAYVNVHTTTFPAGEIRGQIIGGDDDDDDDLLNGSAAD